jgi:NitT/TauT family transport system ATP-binding protein
MTAVSQSVTVTDVSMDYEISGGQLRALESTNLTVPVGGFVSIVGPSGCGKSTLLKLIMGVVQPTQGEIVVHGRPVVEPRSDVGIVFQTARLLPWRTVLQNILLPIELRRRPTAEDRQYAQELISMVGLAGFEKRYPSELSGGMQQRASICRALVTSPDLLLLDEPFGALDALTREVMNAELNRIWRQTGKSAILITHSIEEAVFLSERVLVMSPRPGTIVDEIVVQLAAERNLSDLSSIEFKRASDRVREHFR